MNYKLKTVDAETLLSTPMSKTMFIVDGLIPQGVNVISGASKIGKSWLMLWLGFRWRRAYPYGKCRHKSAMCSIYAWRTPSAALRTGFIT